MTIATVLDNSASGDALYFDAPVQLQKVDLTESAETLYQRTYENVAAMVGEENHAEREHIAMLQQSMLARLVEAGAVYVAHAVARSEANPDRLCTAQYTVLIRDVEVPESLSILANGMKERGEPRETAVVEYPAGEAVVVGEELEIRPEMTAGGRPNTESYRMRQAQVLLPFPNRRRLAVIGVSSSNLEDWDNFVRMLDDIANSASFKPPASTGVAARLDALG